jgi:XRE family aerobic/anaerobic benzoate catabolism transcriptional regulator
MIAYLVGFRGAGKTTLGKMLAQELGWKFLDLDDEWERRRGQSILDFVDENGTEPFRREECALLRETEALTEPTLVATGGGLVDHPASLEFLERSRNPKIYLEVDASLLWARLLAQPERRKIGKLTSFEALQALLDSRRPSYEKIATFRVINRDITQALTETKQLLRNRVCCSTSIPRKP